MRSIPCIAIAFLLASQLVNADSFAGCVTSRQETMGRQTILAWRIASGSFGGVPIAGLTVVAAVAEPDGNVNEPDGEGNAGVKAIVAVDSRATPAQRDALAGLVSALSGGLIAEVVRVESAPVRFATRLKYVDVHVPHAFEPGSTRR
jgi:hypothetical protein